MVRKEDRPNFHERPPENFPNPSARHPFIMQPNATGNCFADSYYTVFHFDLFFPSFQRLEADNKR